MTDPITNDQPTPDDPMLTAFALGELAPGSEDYLAVEARLAEDAEARAYVEQARAIGQQLRDRYQDTPQAPGLSDAALLGLANAVDAPVATMRRQPPALRRLLPFVGVAACTALATAGVFLAIQKDPAPSETADRGENTAPNTQVDANDQDPPEVSDNKPVDLRAVTKDKLSRPVTIDYNSVPLMHAIKDLSEQTGTQLIVNWPALELVGIDPATLVASTLKDIPARVAIQLILEQVSANAFDEDKLGLTIDEGFAKISTRRDLKTDTDTRVYDINELLAQRTIVTQLKGELMQRMASANGQTGSLFDDAEGYGLFGDEDAFQAGFAFRGEPSKGLRSIGTTSAPDESTIYDIRDLTVRVPNFSNAPGFNLNDSLSGTNSGGSNGGGALFGSGGGGGGGLFGDDSDSDDDKPTYTIEQEALLADRQELVDQYAELIHATVGNPDEWLDEESTLNELNGKLIVKTTPDNHEQIQRLIDLMKPANVKQDGEELNRLAVMLLEDIELGLIGVEQRQVIREIERERRERFAELTDNPFKLATHEPLSTFSVDVDTASYAFGRRTIQESSALPMPDSVRIEEWVNYFDYGYIAPIVNPKQLENGRLTTAALTKLEAADQSFAPFATDVEVAQCPWAEGHQLVRVGIKAMEVERDNRPPAHLVFLLDVSGSMDSSDKLGLVKAGMPLLLDQLNDNDKVSIVVYAGASGLVLEAAPAADKAQVRLAIDKLRAGGSTAGGAGIQLAYDIAQKHFVPGGINRVILCTDGDFNVGTSDTGELVKLVKEKANPEAVDGEPARGVYLSVMGFGTGNLNDEMMEKITNAGNGNYSYIDSVGEAVKTMSDQAGGTLITVAKDVKIQVEFNPAQVASYRLIGYENRVLRDEDFNDDTVDAGDIGAGHSVTALYEIVPILADPDAPAAQEEPAIDELRYQKPRGLAQAADLDELLTLKLRYKPIDAAAEQGTSRKVVQHVPAKAVAFEDASEPTRFAASVAAMGMVLRGSPYRGEATSQWVAQTAEAATEHDPNGYRAQFVRLANQVVEIQQKQVEAFNGGPVEDD